MHNCPNITPTQKPNGGSGAVWAGGEDWRSGSGNSLNYKYHMHSLSRFYIGNPRLGRFFAVDPLAAKYPYNSTYAFSENRVIDGVELEGLEYISANDAMFYISHGKLIYDRNNVSNYTSSAISHGRLPSIISKYSFIPASGMLFSNFSGAGYALKNGNAFAPIKQVDFFLPKTGYTTKSGAYVVKGWDQVSVNMTSTKSARGSAVLLALKFAQIALINYANEQVEDDLDEVAVQIDYQFEKALLAVSNAYDNQFIPDVIMNNKSALSDLLNYVFRGDMGENSFSYKNDKGEYITLYREQYKYLITKMGQAIFENQENGGDYRNRITLPQTQQEADNIGVCGPPEPPKF